MFASRSLAPAEANYSATEGEALAVLFALKRFEPIIQGFEVIVKTDHRALQFIKQVQKTIGSWLDGGLKFNALTYPLNTYQEKLIKLPMA